MNCSDRFRQRMQAAGERTRVDPAEVDGRPCCIWHGCGRRLLGNGECVMGHPQGYEFKAADMQALPLEWEALTCALGELAQAEPPLRDDPRVRLVEDYLTALRARQESPGEGPVTMTDALDAVSLYLLVHPGQRLVLTSTDFDRIQQNLYDGTGRELGRASSSPLDTFTAADSILWEMLRERLRVTENAAIPAALTSQVMAQALEVFADTADEARWRDDARVQAVRDYVRTAQAD